MPNRIHLFNSYMITRTASLVRTISLALILARIVLLQSLHRLFSKYCDKPLVQPRLFARVISVLAATLRRPVRVQDDLGDDSVAQIREVAVNTLVQVISFAGAMAGIQKLSTDEQGLDVTYVNGASAEVAITSDHPPMHSFIRLFSYFHIMHNHTQQNMTPINPRKMLESCR